MGDIESVIDRPRQKGLSIADIYTKLGMERGFFDGWRRSINGLKRRELAKQIAESFSEYFTDMVEETQITTYAGDKYKDEYIDSLKARIKDLESDRNFLRKIILEKLDVIISQFN